MTHLVDFAYLAEERRGRRVSKHFGRRPICNLSRSPNHHINSASIIENTKVSRNEIGAVEVSKVGYESIASLG